MIVYYGRRYRYFWKWRVQERKFELRLSAIVSYCSASRRIEPSLYRSWGSITFLRKGLTWHTFLGQKFLRRTWHFDLVVDFLPFSNAKPSLSSNWTRILSVNIVLARTSRVFSWTGRVRILDGVVKVRCSLSGFILDMDPHPRLNNVRDSSEAGKAYRFF